MLVFVTGAAGFIGRAVVQELLANGHEVLGLARSSASADAITAAGATAHRGDLTDLDSLKSGAKAADGVIHLAFVADFANFAGAAAVDAAAIEAMGEVMAWTGKPLVIASGTMMTPKGVLATEDTEPDRGTPFSVRNQGSDAIYAISKDKGVRGSVIRLAPTVHDKQDRGFIAMFINTAQKLGHATYIGDGSARWPAVHRLDAAVLFRLALEKGKAGATYNAVAEQGVLTRDIAEEVGKKFGIPVQGKSMDEAGKDLGFLAYPLGADNPTSSEKTRIELGWEPAQLGLLDDIKVNYSANTKSKFA
jgi:nucleoside-diphosphate-sugar epimerase